jgi:hypothetical protein
VRRDVRTDVFGGLEPTNDMNNECHELNQWSTHALMLFTPQPRAWC